MVTIRPVGDGDESAIRALVAAAFGQVDEADLVDRLRADGDAVVELAAEEDGAIVGHVMFSRLMTDTGARFAALAPLSVLPGRQGDGIGSALMETGHALCALEGISGVVVLGHPDYYPRVGYSAEAAKALTAPFSGPSFMALALTPGAMSAPTTITYARAFAL